MRLPAEPGATMERIISYRAHDGKLRHAWLLYPARYAGRPPLLGLRAPAGRRRAPARGADRDRRHAPHRPARLRGAQPRLVRAPARALRRPAPALLVDARPRDLRPGGRDRRPDRRDPRVESLREGRVLPRAVAPHRGDAPLGQVAARARALRSPALVARAEAGGRYARADAADL